LAKLYETHTSRETLPPLAEISTALQHELSGFSKFFIVLDALDECTANKQLILNELKKLQPKIRLLITGRPFVSKDVSIFDNITMVQIRASDNDLERFVQGQMAIHETLEEHTSKDSELAKLIIETIVEKAKGM
jgi:hypothetical protein